jgi:hypothetical protein
MNNFNRLERTFARFLSSFPEVKNTVKRLYQFMNFTLHKKKYNHKTNYSFNSVSRSEQETFFGYYDKSPENFDGRFVIFHKTLFSTLKKPNSNYEVEIILKDNIKGTESVVGKSFAYNWQQGTKLQWISKDEFIYNFYDKNSNTYRSQIINAVNKRQKRINYPIYDCFKDTFTLSLNFIRLNQLRPDYGYRNIDKNIDYSMNSNDGIFKVNLKTNTSNIILSIQDVIDFSPDKSMTNAKHKINHIMISPNGDKFIFIHRWFINGGKRVDRLFVCDKEGQNLKLISDEGMVSHCCWNGDNEIIGFLRQKSHGESFYRINTNNGMIELLSEKLLDFNDGHPSIINNRMIFDTYPDRSGMKHLYIYNILADEVIEIGEFNESLKYFNETRCDLHPKWNLNGEKIFIDSVHEGNRKLYEININL